VTTDAERVLDALLGEVLDEHLRACVIRRAHRTSARSQVNG
jgi:DNA-binding FrmR family transcriptional regulator